MIALALAALFFAADPSPPQTASPTPASLQSQATQCLARVCLGDNIYEVFAKLGDGWPPTRMPPGVFSNFDAFGDVTMMEDFENSSVVAIRVALLHPEKNAFIDPYGIAIGDKTDVLQAKRGAPDQTGDVWRYGPVDAAHWLYAVKDGSVTSITVTSLAAVPE